MDVDGDVDTASKLSKSKNEYALREGRKINLVCRQLGCCGVDVPGLQETLWFGKYRPLTCPVCRRSFRRHQDNARHKCLAEQVKPPCDQVGATQCLGCR